MHRSIQVLAIFLFFSGQAASQQAKFPCDESKTANSDNPSEAVVQLSSFVESKSIKRVAPKYPDMAARNNFEGFVQMSFVVDETGNVIDPVIDNYSGHKGFKKEALRAVKQWKYSPAMQDGKPVQQCHQQVQFDFVLDGSTGATRSFIRKYKQASTFLDAQDIEQAESAIQAMHNGNLRNRYENAWLWRLDSYLAKVKKDRYRELESVSKALGSARVGKKQGEILPNEDKLALLQRKFALQVELKQFANALRTMERISKMPDNESVQTLLQPYAEQVKALINSKGNIVVSGQLDGEYPWFHTLARSNFAFANIQGVVKDVELRCKSRWEKFTVAEDNVWHIPPAWGKCRVMVRGDAGASFEIVEVSATAS